MTLIKPDGDDGTAHEILRVAAEQFERAILDLETATKSLAGGEGVNATEARKLAKLLSEATSVYFIEKQKIENSSKNKRGIVHDFAVDFAGAREEIRCRMDRLRTAANPGDISE